MSLTVAIKVDVLDAWRTQAWEHAGKLAEANKGRPEAADYAAARAAGGDGNSGWISDGDEAHAAGALTEIAVAAHLGIPWNAHVHDWRTASREVLAQPDAGSRVEVKRITRLSHQWVLVDRHRIASAEHMDKVIVAAVLPDMSAKTVWLRGWITVADALMKHERTPFSGRGGFRVSHLNDMSTIPNRSLL